MATGGWGATKYVASLATAFTEGKHLSWTLSSLNTFLRPLAISLASCSQLLHFSASGLRPRRGRQLRVWLQIIHTLEWDLFFLFFSGKPEDQQGVVVLRAKCLLHQGSGAGGTLHWPLYTGLLGSACPSETTLPFREPKGLPLSISRSTEERDFHPRLSVPAEGGWRWVFQQHITAANEKAERELWAERRRLNM